MSLLVVGSVAFDAIETPFGKVDRTLGGAATYFSLAASYFTPSSGRRGRRRFRSSATRPSSAAGALIWPASSARPARRFSGLGATARIMNERTTLATELNVFATFSPKLPAVVPQIRLTFFSRTSIPPSAFRAEADSWQAQARRARHHELLDRRTPAELRETLKHTQV